MYIFTFTDCYNGLNVITQHSLGENEKGLPRRMSVTDSSEVINITLPRSINLKQSTMLKKELITIPQSRGKQFIL